MHLDSFVSICRHIYVLNLETIFLLLIIFNTIIYRNLLLKSQGNLNSKN